MEEKTTSVFSIYWKYTKVHGLFALGIVACYSFATFTQKVIAPIFAAKIIALIGRLSVGTYKDPYVYVLFGELAVFMVGSVVLFRFGDYFLTKFKNLSIMSLQLKCIEVIITQSLRFFANSHSGALIARMSRFSKSFEGIVDVLATTFLFSIVQVVGIFFVLFFKNHTVGYTLFGWAALYMFVGTRMAKIRVPIDSKEAKASSLLTGIGADIISNALTVLLFGARRKALARFERENRKYGKAQRKSWKYSNLQNTFQSSLTLLLELGTLFISISFWMHGMIAGSDVALVYVYMGIISTTMWEVGRAYVRFTKYATDGAEMVEIFQRVPEVDLSQAADEQLLANGSIVIKGLTFGYSVGKNVFDNLHLEIKDGEHIGIVGGTGGGKTTLIGMIMKFADPISGTIRIGGWNIASMHHEELRRQIAVVPQDAALLDMTIFENIAYGKEDATVEDVHEAAKKARIHDTIMGLTMGYDTFVGERGMKLSGGQRQRIAIARALIIKPKIIILDEATSALDAKTETGIQGILRHGLKGTTVLIVAHRLATVRHCDSIIVLDNGTIKEKGTHAALMEQDGLYAELVQHQFSV